MARDPKDKVNGNGTIYNGALPNAAFVEGSRIAQISFNFVVDSWLSGSNVWATTVKYSAQLASQGGKKLAEMIAQSELFNNWATRYTRGEVLTWIKQDKKNHTKDDGTSAAGRYYHYLKNKMQAEADGRDAAQPEQTEQAEASRRNAGDGFFKAWSAPILAPLLLARKFQLMHNPMLQEWLRGPFMVEQFKLVHSIICEHYPNDHGLLYEPQYNHKFLTETSHAPGKQGDIVAVDEDAIVKLFAKRTGAGARKGEDFPHIIITSSHAQGETLRDVTNITHGIEALARDSEGQELPFGYIDKGVEPGQTLTIYACDVEKTPMLNAERLLSRVMELKHIARTGQAVDEFKEISPGAKRIAKLMLKCMVDKPELIDVSSDQPMSIIGHNNKKPITLRADAVHVAHHFQLIGYSKGGNVVSDAMRYLVSELTAKRADGKDVFAKHEYSPTRNGDCTMGEHNARNVVRSIAVMALASVEMAISDHDKAHGVRRVSINNQHDLISAHHNYGDSQHDERWIIKGVEEKQGHAPEDMMGRRALGSTVTEADRGYAHNDSRVARRLKEFFASNYGKAAIGHVLFNGHASEGVITIEAATGTTDAQLMAYKHQITTAMSGAGLSGAKIDSHKNDPGMLTLTFPTIDFTKDFEALERLKAAFVHLRHRTKGLVIAQAIIDDELQQQITAATKRSISEGPNDNWPYPPRKSDERRHFGGRP